MTPSQIKHILKLYKMTQRDVAQKMGISPQSLYERLNGQEVSTSTLQGIAMALGIDMLQLYTLAADDINEIDELTQLRRENELLKEILAEKERTIQLMAELIEAQKQTLKQR